MNRKIIIVVFSLIVSIFYGFGQSLGILSFLPSVDVMQLRIVSTIFIFIPLVLSLFFLNWIFTLSTKNTNDNKGQKFSIGYLILSIAIVLIIYIRNFYSQTLHPDKLYTPTLYYINQPFSLVCLIIGGIGLFLAFKRRNDKKVLAVFLLIISLILAGSAALSIYNFPLVDASGIPIR